MVVDRIIVPKSLRYAAKNALNFGRPGINKRATMQQPSGGQTCEPILQGRPRYAPLV